MNISLNVVGTFMLLEFLWPLVAIGRFLRVESAVLEKSDAVPDVQAPAVRRLFRKETTGANGQELVSQEGQGSNPTGVVGGLRQVGEEQQAMVSATMDALAKQVPLASFVLGPVSQESSTTSGQVPPSDMLKLEAQQPQPPAILGVASQDSSPTVGQAPPTELLKREAQLQPAPVALGMASQES